MKSIDIYIYNFTFSLLLVSNLNCFHFIPKRAGFVRSIVAVGNSVKFNVKFESSINQPINDQFYCDIFNVRKWTRKTDNLKTEWCVCVCVCVSARFEIRNVITVLFYSFVIIFLLISFRFQPQCHFYGVRNAYGSAELYNSN